MEDLTGKTICRQIRRTYSGYLLTAVLAAALFGFCAWYCDGALGRQDILTVIMAGLMGIALLLAAFVLCKMAFARHNRIFRSYGGADALAEIIRAGARNPYFRTLPDRKWGLLITERFIVSERNLLSYLELADVRVMQYYEIPDEVQPMSGGAGSLTEAAVTWIFGKFLQKQYVDYRKRHPYPETACTWLLYLWDADGRRHSYQVAPADTDGITAALRALVSDIQMKPMTKR